VVSDAAAQAILASSRRPDTLHVIFQAFDAAGKEIAENIGDEPRAIEAARHKLANTTLSVASEDSRDPEQLKREALQNREPPSDPLAALCSVEHPASLFPSPIIMYPSSPRPITAH
jgi:hypothetical protein